MSGPVRHWAASHQGTVRPSNEDAYLCRPEIGLFAVADGVGGHPAVEAVSLPDDRRDLLLGEVDLAAELAALQVVLAVAIELDPVGPVLDLLPDRLADLVGAVHHLNSLGQPQFP